MATTFEWVKLTVENSKVIVPLLLLLVSATGYNFNESMNKSQQITDSEEQFVNVVNYLSTPTTPKASVTISKPNCNDCKNIMSIHEKEHH